VRVRPETGLTFLGYNSRRPWLWLVDLDAATIGPAGTSLPGNDAEYDNFAMAPAWSADSRRPMATARQKAMSLVARSPRRPGE
jgi:hypothetical protein